MSGPVGPVVENRLPAFPAIQMTLPHPARMIIPACCQTQAAQAKKSLLLFSRQVRSASLRRYRLQLIRLLCPWDLPGKNTGVGCHFLFQVDLSNPGIEPGSPALAGGSFITQPAGKPRKSLVSPHCLCNEFMLYSLTFKTSVQGGPELLSVYSVIFVKSLLYILGVVLGAGYRTVNMQSVESGMPLWNLVI